MTTDLRDHLERQFRAEFGSLSSSLQIVRSPYRICPLGAHIDHQLGKVTALTLDQAVHLVFTTLDGPIVRLKSTSFPDEITENIGQVGPARAGDWGNYLRGAIAALRRDHGIDHGFTGLVSGSLAEGGLSSSAAVGIAYLLALERANGLQLSEWERIEADRVIENEYLGLKNGLLDQAAIILSRKDHLTVIDCAARKHSHVPLGPDAADHRWVIAFSGLRQALVTTGYNQRVQECAEAARLLLAAGGRDQVPAFLGNVSAEEYQAHGKLLNGAPAKRARHFFSESARVEAGIQNWRDGDLASFGQLMSESGQSSIENYECGSPPLIDLYQILCDSPGVLGARFSGAGFRGCCIALTTTEMAQTVAADVSERYASAHPSLAAVAPVLVCRSADGAGLV